MIHKKKRPGLIKGNIKFKTSVIDIGYYLYFLLNLEMNYLLSYTEFLLPYSNSKRLGLLEELEAENQQ